MRFASPKREIWRFEWGELKPLYIIVQQLIIYAYTIAAARKGLFMPLIQLAQCRVWDYSKSIEI